MTFRKKAGLGFLLVGAFGFLVLAGWHYHLKHKVTVYKAKLLQQGEFLSVTQAWPNPVKADPDNTARFSAALNRVKGGPVLSYNQVPSMRSVRFGRALAGSMLPELHYYSTSQTNTWADVAQEVESNQEELNVLRKCLAVSPLDFSLDYKQGFSLPVAHLAKVKLAAQAFWMAEALALHNRDLPAAMTNLLGVLALSQAIQQDHLIISELVQIAIGHIGAAATWEALQTPGWNDAQLQQIQEKWLSLKFIEPMREGLTMERAMSTDAMDDFRSSPDKFSSAVSSFSGAFLPGGTSSGGSSNLMDVLEGAPGRIKAKGTHLIWRYFWSYEDEVRCLQIVQAQLEALRQTNLSWKTLSTDIDTRLKALGIKTATQNTEEHDFFDPKILQARTFFSETVIGNANSIRRALSAETLKEIAATAVALKRFHRRNGTYPAALAELVPGLLSKLPVDRMDGQPLRYRLESDGTFTLYSVGTDGIDGGGKEPPTKQERPRGWTMQRDWVWPTLATPAEIAAFEEEMAQRNKSPRRRRLVQPSISTNSP